MAAASFSLAGCEVERAQVCCLKLDGHRAVFLLLLQQRCNYLRGVGRQCRRQRLQAKLLEVALHHQLFAGEENLAVGRLLLQRGVIEREQQGVVERYPAKARRRQPASHGHAIGQLGLDAKLVEHPVGIVVAFALLHRLLGGHQLAHMLGREVVVLVAEHLLPRLEVHGIVLAEHQAVGGRLQRIAGQGVVIGVGLAVHRQRRRVRVVVNCLDVVDLVHQAGIGLELAALLCEYGDGGEEQESEQQFHRRWSRENVEAVYRVEGQLSVVERQLSVVGFLSVVRGVRAVRS